MQEEILYTPEEIAARLKLSKYTVYEMIKRGDIQAHRIGRSIRVSQSQLEFYFMSTKSAENVYEGDVVREGETTYVQIRGVKLVVSTPLEGRVKVMIRPEDIILSSGTFVSSARNMLPGTVTSVTIDGSSAKVLLDTGIPMYALITVQSLREMDIKTGDALYAIFKTMSIRIIK